MPKTKSSKKTSKKVSKKCSKGKIYRVGYTTKKGSKKVKVKGSCIKATSQTGKKTSLAVKKHFAEREKIYKKASKKFGSVKCKKGSIKREGYIKRSGVWVKPICIKDVGHSKPKASEFLPQKTKSFVEKTGKQTRTIYIEPDRLGKYGYRDVANMSLVARHKSLQEALEKGEKPLSVMRRLTALSTLSKNTNPKIADVFKDDAEWIKGTKEYMSRPTAK